MKLKLIDSKEAENARWFTTRIEENFQINPLIKVRVNGFIAIHQAAYSDLHNLEIQDWDTTYFVGGEECKDDGFRNS